MKKRWEVLEYKLFIYKYFKLIKRSDFRFVVFANPKQISWVRFPPLLPWIFFNLEFIQGTGLPYTTPKILPVNGVLCNFSDSVGGLQSFNLEHSGSVALKPKLPAK